MGIYDRDYYQPQRPGVAIRGPSSMVGWIVAINVALFLANGLLTPGNNLITDMLAAKVGTLTQPWMWWQFLTYGFAHSPWPDYWHILGNMLGLWFLGRDIEYTYGPKEFLRLYLTMIVVGGVAWAATSMVQGLPAGLPLVGASGAVAGIVVLYALHFPRRTLLLFFVLPVPAWAVGVLLVVTNLTGAAGLGNEHIAYGVHLAGVAFALAYYQFKWNLGRLVEGRFSLDWLKPRPKLRVHDPDRSDRRDRQKTEDLSAEVDRILEKIHQHGEESLTRKERRTLEAASRQYQKNRRGD